MPKSIFHSKCLGCGALLPEPFLDLGTTPLANSYVDPAATEPEPRFPLRVAYCEHCHLVQLTHLTPPEELFSEYAYFSSFSESVVRHAAQMAAELTARFGLGRDHRVLEIASNDGYLLRNFCRSGIPVLGVEPARNIAQYAIAQGIPTLNEFFGPELVPRILEEFGPVDLVIGNNVLAHVPAINDFLKAVHDVLKPSGWAVFEFPYVGDLIENREFDTIYHEHVFYYSLSAIARLAERAQLRLADVSHQPIHGGSLRVFLTRQTNAPVSESVTRLLAAEEQSGLLQPARYRSFARAVEQVKDQLKTLLAELKASGHRIGAYGAPAKGNTLLNYCGIGTETIEFTVDRNPHKQGKLLPGSRIPILPPEELLRRMPDFTVILPWNITDEIVGQQSEYLRGGGRFIIPVPEPRLLDSEQGARTREKPFAGVGPVAS